MTNSNRFANKRKADISVHPNLQTSLDPMLRPLSSANEGETSLNWFADANEGETSLNWFAEREKQQQENLSPNERDRNNQVDGLLAEELLKMSFVDRNTIIEEVHGVRSLAVKETPRLIESSLQSFQIELDLLPDTNKQAYIFIQTYRQQQNRQYQRNQLTNAYSMMQQRIVQVNGIYAPYVDDDHFRLRFLRCCLFNIRLAVRRFANYLNFIQTYWGNSYLARPIQMTDLNAAETKILKRGMTQVFPFRDRRGRRIVANLQDGSDMEDIASAKAWFYVFDSVSRDSVETQRNGVISILDGAHFKTKESYSNFNLFSFSPETKKRIGDIMKMGETLSPLIDAHHAMPTRVAGIHVCWPHTPLFNRVLKFYLFHSPLTKSENSPVDVSRIRIHTGEETEMRYKVKSYGIPIELLPLTGTNSIKLNYHNQWMKTRKLVEGNQLKYQFQYNCGYKPEYDCGFDSNENKSNSGDKLVTIVECPCSSDVVFRNGTQSMENPGNAMFRNSILTYWEGREANRSSTSYSDSNNRKGNLGTSSSAADDAHDRKFRDELVREIEIEKGGRFLEWDKSLNVWVQMKDKARIHRKVAMAFYNCTKRRYTNANINKRRGRSKNNYNNKNLLAYQFIEKDRAEGGPCCFNGNASASASGSSDDDEMPNKRACL